MLECVARSGMMCCGCQVYGLDQLTKVDVEMNMSSPMSLSSACCGILLLGGKIPETA